MKHNKQWLRDGAFSAVLLAAAFAVNLIIQHAFHTRMLIPMIFVLAVFLIARKTEGYLPGIAASLVSVFAVNYAFTFPYYAFDLLTPVCLFSAVVMLLIAIMTSTLTTKIKLQEKARAEIELEKMRANLLRGISHDLRTPLTAIYGSTSVMMENYDALDKAQQLKFLGEIRSDSEWLIRMVENLLSVTRIDGGTVSVHKTPIVLEELIDNVVLKFKKRWDGQVLAVTIPDAFVSIPMDALLIEQVISNLLENAMLHAKGMTALSLTVHVQNNTAVFEVADDGCGIPKELLGTLFSGCRVPPISADSGRHSMGIGLMVCATIIKAHGGKISAANRRMGGAVFRFTLQTEESNNGE